MEWKKETMSVSELERRQKEYMNAAMSMVKRSQAAVSVTEHPQEREPAEQEPVTAVSEENVTAQAAEAAEAVTAEAEVTAAAEEAPEPAPVPEKEPEHEPEEQWEPEQDPVSEENANYGVYTADELLNGEAGGAGLKKAAEILEEMTRSTEMMRKLASDGENSDTTDFPEFSCGADSEEGEDCFREKCEQNESGPDECEPPEES